MRTPLVRLGLDLGLDFVDGLAEGVRPSSIAAGCARVGSGLSIVQSISATDAPKPSKVFGHALNRILHLAADAERF